MTKIKVYLDELHMCKIPEYSKYLTISKVSITKIHNVEYVSQIFGESFDGKSKYCNICTYGGIERKFKFVELFIRHMLRHKLKFDKCNLKLKPNMCINFREGPMGILHIDGAFDCDSISITFKIDDELRDNYIYTGIFQELWSYAHLVCIGEKEILYEELRKRNVESSVEEYEIIGSIYMYVCYLGETDEHMSIKNLKYLAKNNSLSGLKISLF